MAVVALDHVVVVYPQPPTVHQQLPLKTFVTGCEAEHHDPADRAERINAHTVIEPSVDDVKGDADLESAWHWRAPPHVPVSDKHTRASD